MQNTFLVVFYRGGSVAVFIFLCMIYAYGRDLHLTTYKKAH